MPYLAHDVRPVTHITIDAMGQPGERVFYLQATRGPMVITLLIEKEQARALADGVEEMLQELERVRPRQTIEVTVGIDLRLMEPIEPAFRVGPMQLGYHEEDDMLVIVAQEMTEEEEEERARVVRLWATREQMHALSEHALQVVAGGRPLCPVCGEPINPTGHFCSGNNGHRLV